MTKLEDIFKDIFWDMLIHQIFSRLVIAAPYLALWPISAVVSFIFFSLTDKLYLALELLVDLRDIRFNNELLQIKFDTEMVNLRMIAEEKGVDSDEFKKARELAKKELNKFARIN